MPVGCGWVGLVWVFGFPIVPSCSGLYVNLSRNPLWELLVDSFSPPWKHEDELVNKAKSYLNTCLYLGGNRGQREFQATRDLCVVEVKFLSCV